MALRTAIYMRVSTQDQRLQSPDRNGSQITSAEIAVTGVSSCQKKGWTNTVLRLP